MNSASNYNTRDASNLYIGVIECAEFKYFREIHFKFFVIPNN